MFSYSIDEAMPSTCEFLFNNSNRVYYSGDTISGTIVLTTTAPKNVRNISINFRGEGKVKWEGTERRRRSDGSYEDYTVYYTSSEVYVNHTTVVMGPCTLPVGTKSYEFQIPLPLESPTSSEFQYGHIRYELTLKLDRPLRFDNKFSKPLTIIRKQDLNLDPIYKVPLASEDFFTASCWSCTGGRLNATLILPFSGYAIGQRVRYSLRLENQLMEDVLGYTIDFKRHIKFTAYKPCYETKEVKSILFTKSYEDERCLRLTNRIFKGSFAIGSTPPTTEGENIIDIKYYLKVELNMSGCSSDHSLEVPIFVGTVPVRESLLPPTPPQVRERDRLITVVEPSAPELEVSNGTDAGPPPNYEALAPPSFEEATRRCSAPFVDTDKDEQNRHTDFRPLYPMYSQNDDFYEL